jgi:hypothetical protein
MTKGPGQKHFQRENHAHAAHKAEAERAIRKFGQIGRSHVDRGGPPIEELPTAPAAPAPSAFYTALAKKKRERSRASSRL